MKNYSLVKTGPKKKMGRKKNSFFSPFDVFLLLLLLLLLHVPTFLLLFFLRFHLIEQFNPCKVKSSQVI